MIETPRDLPSAQVLLNQVPHLVECYGYQAVLGSVRKITATARVDLLAGHQVIYEHLMQEIEENLIEEFQPSLRPIINATGVILHTNLGRAPLSLAASQAVAEIATSYNTLEFDLETGKRGKRHTHIESLVAETIGAEAAMVVNNAASAILLTLSALAHGKSVIISRGQLIEIGGGFRIPDVMLQSAANLIEVGTTNRTRLADYANAITDNTAAILRVHPSNFRMIGFTEETPLADLMTLAHQHGLYCLDDLGSGALLDTASFGLSHEPTPQESLALGADVVIFSGDKLLGGPQAGLIVGKAEALNRLKKHPLARALRVDKMTIAALAATLRHYQHGEALTHIPIWQMISKHLETIHGVCQSWATHCNGRIEWGESTIGGGSLPDESLPTYLFSPEVSSAQNAQELFRKLEIPIIARVKNDRLWLDPRTVLPHQVDFVGQALRRFTQ